MHLQHLFNENLRFIGHILPLNSLEANIPEGNVVKDLLIVLPIEWRVPAQQDVQDDAAGPDIAFLIVFLLQDLGCYVEGCPHAGIHVFVRLKSAREPEVNHFDLICVRFHYEEVLWLEVTVDYFLGVTVCDGGKQLFHDLSSDIFVKVLGF